MAIIPITVVATSPRGKNVPIAMYSQFNVKEKFLEEYNWSYEGRVNDDSETKIRK